MSAATTEIDQDLVKAGLIQQIQGETELRTRQGEAQQRRQMLVEKLKATTQKINQQIADCDEINLSCDRLLTAIDRSKGDLLRSTPEGKQIFAIQAEIKELKWKNQEPQLPVLKRKLEIAEDRGEPENAAILRSQIANLESKIEQYQSEIERLWTSFGFDADSLRRV